jgi:hypothetical protein
VSSSNARLTRWRLAGVIAAVGAFVIAGAGTGSAATFGSPYQVPLDPSTTTPVKAADFSPTGGCDGIVPANEDGWHFAVPDTFSAIVSLDLTFNSRPGALGVVFTQDRQQAFVATLPGAQLMQASATVMTAAGRERSACMAGPIRRCSAARSATAACACPRPRCACSLVSRSAPSC